MKSDPAAPVVVSAPGKLMIAGEYVVLRGADALVCAVERRATARWAVGSPGLNDGSAVRRSGSREREGLPPESSLACLHAEEAVGAVPMTLELDVTPLRRAGQKIGLGSSSAAAAAVAGAVFAWHGHDLADSTVKKRVLDVALSGHRAVASGGSGADVAASVLGGYLRVRRRGDVLETEPARWPAGWVARIVWTGNESRTDRMLRAVADLSARDSRLHAARMDALAEAARELLSALERADGGAALGAVSSHHRAMGRLGDAAGVPIVEERLERIASLAADFSGAAKPSGAGGGDVALAVFEREEDADGFASACHTEGFKVLEHTLGAEGLAVDRERNRPPMERAGEGSDGSI